MGVKRKIAVIDAETDPFRYLDDIQPFIWGFYDGEIYEEFEGDNLLDCTEKLIKYLSELDGKYYIYAHNGGRFDYFFMVKYFAEDIKLINGRISNAKLDLNNDITFRDSLNIIPIPLSAYKKNDIDYDKMHRDVRHLHMPEIRDYLRSDCIYHYELVSAFVERFGNKLTISGVSFSEISKTGYGIPKTYDNYDTLMRLFYFGGRVQCFEVGEIKSKKKLRYVDINSAYPYAMTHQHPYGSAYKKIKVLPTVAGGWMAEISAISNGCLPVRGKDGTLFYPTDDVVRVYDATGWEIVAGLDTGTLDVVEVHIVFDFDDYRDFNDFVLPVYNERLDAKKNGDKLTALFNKFLMNAGYGKFGQDGRRFEDYKIMGYGDKPPCDNECKCDGSICDDNPWKTLSTLETGERIYSRPAPSDRFYNVATASSITGFVRAMLWREICACERPIYCDTDSIMCAKFYGDMGDNLGEWSDECDFNTVYIAQKKMYAVKTNEIKEGKNVWKVASKGVRLTHYQIVEGVKTGVNITVEKQAPAFSIKFGVRYLTREVDFSRLKS